MTNNRIYFIRIRGRVIGPKELPDMQQLARRAQLNSRTPVSEDGLSWQTAADFPEIFTKATAAPPPEQQPPAEATAKQLDMVEEWHYAINGQQQPNPVTLATLQSYVQAGTLKSSDLVFRSGWEDWRPVSTVPELFGLRPGHGNPTGQTSRTEEKPATSSGFGIASLVCGILGLLFFGCVFGPIAIVLGIIGASQKGPDTSMAWTGVVLGIVDLIGWLVLMAILFN